MDTESAPKATENMAAESVAENGDGSEAGAERTELDGEVATDSQQQARDQDNNKPQTVYYCGSALTEAMQQYPEPELNISTPIQEGIVKDWGAMEALWCVLFFLTTSFKACQSECSDTLIDSTIALIF